MTLRQIVKIESKIIQIELKTGHKVEILADLRNNLIILVLKNKNNASDHGLMHRHYGQLKASCIYLLTQPNSYANFFILTIDHMQNRLEDKNVLFLHFLNLELKLCCQFGTVLKLWKLDHLALLNVNLEAPGLIYNLLGGYLLPLLLAQLGDGVQQRHQV